MNTPNRFSITAMELGPMENFVYLIHDIASNRCAVVDPAWETAKIIAKAREMNTRITDILLTHSHHDHVNGIADILDAYDAQVHLLKEEAQFWGYYQDVPSSHHGGDIIQLGETAIEILHTPGHTPGSACYHIDGNLITGDTLFVYGCGRCDLHGGDPERMFQTLKHISGYFDRDTVIHPGHNYADTPVSSLTEQIQGNPFLHFDNVADFVRYRMYEHDKIRETPYHAVHKTK